MQETNLGFLMLLYSLLMQYKEKQLLKVWSIKDAVFFFKPEGKQLDQNTPKLISSTYFLIIMFLPEFEKKLASNSLNA